jgi:hypothetical protein
MRHTWAHTAHSFVPFTHTSRYSIGSLREHLKQHIQNMNDCPSWKFSERRWSYPFIFVQAIRSYYVRYDCRTLENTHCHLPIQEYVKLRFCMKLHHFPIFWQLIIARKPCSPVNEIQKRNHVSILMTMPNQNNSKNTSNYTVEGSKKAYWRNTKSARNAVNECDLDKLIGNFISVFRRADLLWF